jgi:hypothetical protein
MNNKRKMKKKKESVSLRLAWWLKPVILAIWEAEIRRMVV